MCFFSFCGFEITNLRAGSGRGSGPNATTMTTRTKLRINDGDFKEQRGRKAGAGGRTTINQETIRHGAFEKEAPDQGTMSAGDQYRKRYRHCRKLMWREHPLRRRGRRREGREGRHAGADDAGQRPERQREGQLFQRHDDREGERPYIEGARQQGYRQGFGEGSERGRPRG